MRNAVKKIVISIMTVLGWGVIIISIAVSVFIGLQVVRIGFVAVGEYDGCGEYAIRLGVYIPDREPDFYEDTHGGFHGDGKYIAIYRLTEEEKKLIETDTQLNENWKRIDEKSLKYLYGGIPGIYSEGYTLGEIPVIDDGYYITYDKKTWQSTLALSGNYIICEYSIKDNTLYIFELDT